MNHYPRIGLIAAIMVIGALRCLSADAASINVFPDTLVAPCQLREAIQSANTDTSVGGCTAGSGTDTLVLLKYNDRPYFSIDNPTGSDEDANATGDLDVTSAIIIQGENPSQSVIIGPPFDRVFDVRTNGALSLNNVTVIGGSIVGASANDGGVARKVGNGTLTITRSVLRGGNADLGGALYAQGSGALSLERVTLMDNTAGYGGAIALQQTSGVEAQLNNVTISGNTAHFSGGGLYGNSWFRMKNGTVARNRSAGAGGVHYAGTVDTTGVNFANSVLVDNVNGNGDASDLYCAGTIGNNQLGARSFTLIGGLNNCTFASFIGTPPSADARLTPLFDSGAGVPTHALLSGSVALGAGNPSNSSSLTSCLGSDARGVSRSMPCDLGAYEERFDVTVNSFSDLPDLNPGDGVCQALGNVCTLRAVAMEASETRGRWFVKLEPGIYNLTRGFNDANDQDGGDIDVVISDHDLPFQMTLFGIGDADDTQIVGGGFDRVLQVRGRNVNGPMYQYIHYPLAFALLNATVRGGVLNRDPTEFDPNAQLTGGGIKITGGKSLLYNVVVRDNYVESLPAEENSEAGGVFVDVRLGSNSTLRPYQSSAWIERFAIVDNATTDAGGGYSKFAGGLYVSGAGEYEISDSVTLTNGTIAGNYSRAGGGAMLFGGVDASFLSIVDNSAGPLAPPGFTQWAGGLTLGGQNNTLRNVLIAGNHAGTDDSDCEVGGTGSSIVSLGYNLIATSGAGCIISGDIASNLLNVDPLLGARATVAGMPIHAPATDGPAVDAIPRSACGDGGSFGVALDARGARRPGAGSNLCDIGAVEVDLPLFADGFE
jgi:hypothetical protein